MYDFVCQIKLRMQIIYILLKICIESSFKSMTKLVQQFQVIKKAWSKITRLQAIWDDFQLIEFVIVYLWGFWVATLCIRTPLDEEAHQRRRHCGFALWLGTQDSRLSARSFCRWCTTAPAGSRSLWSTADIDPMGNCNICTLGKEVNVLFVTQYTTLFKKKKKACTSTHLRWCPDWMQWHNVHQTQRVYRDRSHRGTALGICEYLPSAGTPPCIHSAEKTFMIEDAIAGMCVLSHFFPFRLTFDLR